MSKTTKNFKGRDRFHKNDRVERKMSESARRHIEDSLAVDEYDDEENKADGPHSRYNR